MTKARRDGLYLLVVGIATFILFGSALKFMAKDSMEDFKVIYFGTRCLVQHCDPYRQSELIHFYREELGELNAIERRHSATLYVNLPTTFLFIAPFTMLPPGAASVLWMILTAASLTLAALLTWNLGACYAPIVCGALISLLIANSAVLLGNGNPAGIVVGLCVIAVWCFLKERFVVSGILCFAVSLAIKPHDAGLVWLYFLLAGGVHRKRALQTLAVTAVLCLAAVLWVSRAAPHWMPELRANLAETSAQGGNNDPGPAGPTSRNRSMEAIIDLQAALSVFRDDPGIYDAASYLVCGALLLVWLLATLRSDRSPAMTWFALAAVVPLTMLVTYHRAYDARLLLLTIPACATLWAEGGAIGRIAVLVNTLGIAFTGEIALAILILLTKNLHPNPAGLFGKIETLLLMRLSSLVLLVMAVFYLWAYVRAAGKGLAVSGNKTTEAPIVQPEP